MTLADRIVASAVAGMQRHGHEPSAQAIESYRATAETIEKMAKGEARSALYLATGPTGSGKTESLRAAVKAIVDDPAYRAVGVLVLTNTLDQIPTLIERMGLRDDQYAVRVGWRDRPELNNMGLTGYRAIKGMTQSDIDNAHHSAQVLFVTQAKMQALAEHNRSYKTNAFYSYNGNQRRVILWDEAFLPIDPIVVTVEDIGFFAQRLSHLGYPLAAKCLLDWLEQMETKQPDFDTVPEWIYYATPNKQQGETWQTLKDALSEGGEQFAIVADAMFTLPWKTVRLEFEEWKKTLAAISYRRTIPYDIEPLLVFDADANQALHYRLMQKWGGNVVLQPGVDKTYRNLTIRYYDRAAGHAAYRKKKDIEELAEATAQAICDKPMAGQVLVVHRKLKKAPATTLLPLIKSKVASRSGGVERVSFLTWGRHKATNVYREHKHIILVGLHQAPITAIRSMVHGYTRTPMDEQIRDVDVEHMRMSQMRGDMLQAVGRGASRNMVNGDVPSGCTLDVIASSWGPMGFKKPYSALKELFPGAALKPWLPEGAATSSSVAVGAAKELLGQEHSVLVTTKHWAIAAGYSERSLKGWLNKGSLVGELAAEGISVETVEGKGGGRRLRRKAADAHVTVHFLI